MEANPLETASHIIRSYIDYLTTTFFIRDAIIAQQLRQELEAPGAFSKGPIVEITPRFELGRTPEQLVCEGILSSEFRLLGDDRFPMHRPLYLHQDRAIQKAILQKRNLVVATGTGSGKTDAFMIPILNHLFCEKQNGTLGPGVRALLLYPMNALANDQMRRLRLLLANYPSITFGRYTGETRHRHADALGFHREMFGEGPLPNEIISREQMLKNPPHILLTNYAMLEYLLLRPQDHVFFDGELARFWRFLVVDEAHVYTGAKGIEMAMLIRRLKDRLRNSSVDGLSSFQCIATSATLGSESVDCEKIALFARNLFDTSFEWVSDDDARQDVITATRNSKWMADSEWGSPDPSLYERLSQLMHAKKKSDKSTSIIELMANESLACGVPSSVVDTASQAATPEEFLYKLLQGDSRVRDLANMLMDSPREFQVVAKCIFDTATDIHSAGRNMSALIELVTRARLRPGDQPLLPARYHMFVRAVDGAYISLYESPELFLQRMQGIRFGDTVVPVFEIASCRRCGNIYLVGKFDKTSRTFRQVGDIGSSDSGIEYYWLAGTRLHFDDVRDPDEDEATGLLDDLDVKYERFELCTKCGSMDKSTSLLPICGCDPSALVTVVKARTRDGNVYSCPACGSVSSTPLVHRFTMGAEAVTAVLATALYQKTPAVDQKKETSRSVENEPSSDREISVRNDDRGNGRQLLVFSDSRQDAAFFATYLDRTYNRILRRRLIMKAIEDNCERINRYRWRIQDLIEPLRALAEDLGLFGETMSPQAQINECWRWLLYEFISVDPRNSLGGLGCLTFEPVKPRSFFEVPRLMQPPLELSPEEIWTFYCFMFSEFVRNGAVAFPSGISITDDFFAPKNRARYFRQDKRDPKDGVLSWTTQSSKSQNRRTDYIAKLAKAAGYEPDLRWCKEFLAEFWEKGLGLGSTNSEMWSNYFKSRVIKGGGTAFQVNPDMFELCGYPGALDQTWWICDRCNTLTRFNIRNVCPTYQCTGSLRRCLPEQDLSRNHYRRLYLTLDLIPMRSHEHTAQLSTVFASSIQTAFSRGEINVLSCSTTFELGVDVGDLESVFLRNVPPTAANYVQRAGRAGRRSSSVAFVLTFASARSHDFTLFRDPFSMVQGKLSPPHFDIANDKIVRRHMYAVALASYWRNRPEAFGLHPPYTVEAFHLDDQICGYEGFLRFLSSRPKEVAASLQRIVPKEMHDKLGLSDWRWVTGLASPDKTGVLDLAWLDIRRDLKDIQEAIQRMVKAGRRSDWLLRCMETIKKRDLIGYLSSRNVLPKYGFPVDVVELGLENHRNDAQNLELTRDLRIAISEYAPDSEVVAAGKVWTSRYIKRPPNREWIRRGYAVCEHCGHYQSWLSEVQDPPSKCVKCGYSIKGKDVGVFIVPEFGFMSDLGSPGVPGESKPETTYSTRVYFAGSDDQGSGVSLDLNGVTVRAVPAVNGRLAVLNHAGYNRFRICDKCGYAVIGGRHRSIGTHKTPWGADCTGKLSLVASLGHEFESDVVFLIFEGCTSADISFWQSLLYSMLEGASQALNIERSDLDGCLHFWDQSSRALVLFDDVPGGAGHVRRIVENEKTVAKVILEAYKKLTKCTCGGELKDSSCYGCLRNYRNQHVHELLNRGIVLDFFESIGVPELLQL